MLNKCFITNVKGNTTVLFALSAPVLLGAAGAAIMYTHLVKTETDLQAAVDAGALAGTALTAEYSDAQRIKSAMAAFKGNFSGNGEFTKGGSDYVVASSGVAPTFTVSNWEVSGEATATIDNPFSFILGKPEMKVKVKAAAAKMESEPICILGLNPEKQETIDMSGQPVISANGCAVQANSSNGAGLNQKGKPELRAKTIGTSGGFTGSGYSPKPITGTIPVPDPFSALPFPEHGECNFNNVTISGSTKSLDPGVYCGGIKVTAGGSAVLKKGIYILKDGPLWVTGGGFVRGNDVLIAFTGPDATLYMNGTSSLDLTSPSKGPYANMQFMQEPGTGGDDLYFSVIGNNTVKWDGALYLPTLDVWFGGGTIATISSPGYAIVADKVWVQDQSEVNVTLENKRNVKAAILGYVRFGARLIR